MIIEILEQAKDTSRGRICHVIDYIFDADADGYSADRKHREEVVFIGASDSLCCTNPFQSPKDQFHAESQTRMDLNDIKHAFEEMENKNQRAKHPFLHIVISLRPGESLTPSQWSDLIADYVAGMGYKDNLWVSCIHRNTLSEHAHLILCCIENTAPFRKTKDSNNFAKSARVRNKLEQKYDLEQDNNPFISGKPGKNVNNSHINIKVQVVRDEVDRLIDDSKKSVYSLPNFIDDLADAGIGCFVRLNEYEVEGLSFSLGIESFAGTALGIGYKWRDLQKRGLRFEHIRDLDDVLYANEREKSVSLLVENAYGDVNLQSENTDLNRHYLLEPNADVVEFPNHENLHGYNVFKLLTPFPSAIQSLKNVAQHKLVQMRKLRKALYSAYDFIYSYSAEKLHSVLDYTICCKTNIQHMFERSVNQNPIKCLINQPSNQECITDTGFLLVSAKQFHQDGPSNREYALETAAERQAPIAEEVVSLDNLPSVTVFGDYHDIDKSDIDSAVDKLPSNNANTIFKGVQPKSYKRPNDSSDFTF